MTQGELMTVIREFVEEHGGKYVMIGTITEMEVHEEEGAVSMTRSQTFASGSDDIRLLSMMYVTMGGSLASNIVKGGDAAYHEDVTFDDADQAARRGLN